jgi:hypothetical protein
MSSKQRVEKVEGFNGQAGRQESPAKYIQIYLSAAKTDEQVLVDGRHE